MKPSSSNGSGERSRSFVDVEIGERLPDRTVEASLASMVMYAAATWDFHRGHYDGEFAKKHGFDAPFVDGQMIGALLAREVMAWGGPDAFLRVLDYRVTSMLYAGERMSIAGEVVDKKVEAGRSLVTWKLNVSGPDGAEVVKNAEAVIELGIDKKSAS